MVSKDRPPATGTGDSLLSVELSPSCPLLLVPQQYPAPEVLTVQTYLSPTLKSVKVRPPTTPIGSVLHGFPPQLSGPVSFPIPSSPALLSPQQYATPPFSRAHLERLPKLIAPKVWPPPTGAQVQPLPQYVAPPVAKPHQYP